MTLPKMNYPMGRNDVFREDDRKRQYPTTPLDVTLRVANAVDANWYVWKKTGSRLFTLYQWGMGKIGVEKLRRRLNPIERHEFAYALRRRGWSCRGKENGPGLWIKLRTKPKREKRPRIQRRIK